MYYEEVPVTTKPEKAGPYFIIHKFYQSAWFENGKWIIGIDEREIFPTHYLRPVIPSPDVEAAAREYAHKQYPINSVCEDLGIPSRSWEPYIKAFLSGHTRAMMSKGVASDAVEVIKKVVEYLEDHTFEKGEPVYRNKIEATSIFHKMLKDALSLESKKLKNYHRIIESTPQSVKDTVQDHFNKLDTPVELVKEMEGVIQYIWDNGWRQVGKYEWENVNDEFIGIGELLIEYYKNKING